MVGKPISLSTVYLVIYKSCLIEAKQLSYFSVFSRCNLEFYPRVLLSMPSRLPVTKNAISRRTRRGENIRQNNGRSSKRNERAVSWPARNTGSGAVTSALPATLLG